MKAGGTFQVGVAVILSILHFCLAYKHHLMIGMMFCGTPGMQVMHPALLIFLLSVALVQSLALN